jgi:tRNA pseudouridine38-40 synthase
MRNIKLLLSYDGSNFFGWQVQKFERTIQGELEKALGKILSHEVRVTGSGRTDAGVHAVGQVANFRTAARIECEGLRRGLNSLLPKDVRVLAVSDMPDEFDARRSALSRMYRYLIWRGRVGLPFARHYTVECIDVLDVTAMEEAGSYLLGTHDFASFAGAGSDGSTIREMLSVSAKTHPMSLFTQSGEIIEITIEANAFLRHMVRNIVGTLMEVGRKKRKPDELLDILGAADRSHAGPTAPARGLYLMEVKYPPCM